MTEEVIRQIGERSTIFRLIAENVTDLIAVLDTNGRRVYCSPSYERLLGDPEQLLGTQSFAEIHPDDRAAVAEVFRQTVATGVGRRARFRFVLPDGSHCHIESESSVVLGQNGQVEYVVVVSRASDMSRAQERLGLALESAGMAIFEWDMLSDEFFLDEAWEKTLGAEPLPTVSTVGTFEALIHPDDVGGFRRIRASALADSEDGGATAPQRCEFRTRSQNGETLWIEARGRVMERDAQGRAVRMLGTLADIGERKQSEQRLTRLSNLYAALSQTNQAIVRCKSRASLFEEICRVAVQYAQFRMAWICMADFEAGTLDKVAAWGDYKPFQETLPWSLDAREPKGRGPAASALRDDRPYICNDLLADPHSLPWREAIARSNFRSTASFPIHQNGEPVGILGLYALEPDFFDDTLIELLEGMASDISFALDNFELEASRRASEKALAESESLKSAILQSALDCVITIDKDGRIVDFNPAAEQVFGYARTEVMGRLISETIIPPAMREEHKLGMRRYQETGAARVLGRRIEVIGMRSDGSEFPLEIAIAPIQAQGRSAFTAYLRDITESKLAQEKIVRLSNLYAARSQTSRAIARISDRERLFAEVCRIAAEYGRLQLAWIGVPDPQSKIVRPLASSGPGKGYIDRVRISIDPQVPEGCGLFGSAIRENRASICNDFMSDPKLASWHAAGAVFGFQSLAVFPVRQGGQPMGAIGFYADQRDFFDDERVSLLDELAADVSFALDNFEREASRRRAEIALLESEARYRELVESSPEAIFIHRGGRFLLVNAACVQLLNVPDAVTLIGESVLKFIHPDFHELVVARGRKVGTEHGGVPFVEQRWIRYDGASIDVESAATYCTYRGQAATQVVLRDITDRKHTERVLRSLAEGASYASGEDFLSSLMHHLALALEVRYAAIAEIMDPNFESSRLITMWAGSDWRPGFVYTLENSPCFEVLRYNMLVHYSQDVQGAFPKCALLSELGVSSYMGLPLLGRGNKIIGHIFVMHDQPIRNAAHAKSILGVFAARAGAELERMKAEVQLRDLNAELEQRVEQRTADLQLAVKDLESFSYSVSHDLRAPLRAIIGFSQILLEAEAEQLSDDGQKLFERIVISGKRMAELVDDILEYSRTGRQSLARHTVDLTDIARAVAAEMRDEYPKAVVRIADLGTAQADPTMLRQIFSNLIGNALKFSSKREQPEVDVDCRFMSGERVYRVRDNGAGFDMQYAGKLFGMFQRMHTANEFSGTGVGLAIVKRVVERHGGRVWATAAPDQGATLFFTLGRQD